MHIQETRHFDNPRVVPTTLDLGKIHVYSHMLTVFKKKNDLDMHIQATEYTTLHLGKTM